MGIISLRDSHAITVSKVSETEQKSKTRRRLFKIATANKEYLIDAHTGKICSNLFKKIIKKRNKNRGFLQYSLYSKKEKNNNVYFGLKCILPDFLDFMNVNNTVIYLQH